MYVFFQADKNQAKFLGELPEELLAKEDKDEAKISSSSNLNKPEDEGEAKEQSASEGSVSDVSSHPATGTGHDQPKSDNSTSDKDKDKREDEPECDDGDRVKNTSGNDASDTAECPTSTEDKPDSELPLAKSDSKDGAPDKIIDDHGAPNDTEVAMPDQEKKKERPVIVSQIMFNHAYVTVPFPFQNPSQCWWLSVTKWAVENKLGPNLVEYVNTECSINDDPYRTTKIKYVSAVEIMMLLILLFSPLLLIF